MVKVRKNLTGMRFGRWLVLEQTEDHIEPSGNHCAQWLCLCDCGTQKIINGYVLRRGSSKSCGCLSQEVKSETHKKYNTYDLTSKEYGIGYTSTGEEFWFDKEDYDLIKDYCWHYGTGGYLKTNLPGGDYLIFHRFIMGVTNESWLSTIVDHKKHGTMDEFKYDNRKENLRKVTRSRNNQNIHKRKDNTSGVTGVTWHKKQNAWYASISVDKKRISLGYFNDFKEAVIARKAAEEKYFGEYSFDNSQK